MRIGIDVDGVVADLHTPWLRRIAARVGRKVQWDTGDITQWAFWDDLGVEESLVWEVYTPDIYDAVEPFDGAAWAMEELRKAGHTVVFVTQSRSKEMFAAKVTWLLRHDVAKLTDEIHAVGSWAEYKSKNDPRLNLQVLLDDTVENLKEFDGVKVLMTLHHNRRTLAPYTRVRHLADFVAWAKHHNVPAAVAADVDEHDMANYDYAADHCAGGAACWTTPVNVGGQGLVVPSPAGPAVVRTFSTGANRDVDTGKLDYEGFLSPLALRSFAEFMHQNRYLKDGSLRDSDNWQKGIPLDVYMKSMFRHFMEVWMLHRGLVPLDEKGQPVDMEKALNALHFNNQGYQHEWLKAKSLQDKVA